jgi:MoaA/NifB/PqqE/SkfB family radical SAM enzyme
VTRPVDRITEGQRERELMAAVRGGQIAEADVEQHTLPFFVKIQIQTVSPCNAACVMCPWPETSKSLPQGFMKDEVFARIVDQIAGRGVERTSLFLMNEPTLDRRLERFTALLKGRDPATAAVIYTNGVLLDGSRAVALADAGMDEVTVSVIGFDRETYARNMVGCDYDRVMANLSEIGAARAKGRLGRMRVQIAGLILPGVAEQAAAFEQRTGLPVLLKPVTNRAGLVDTGKLGAAYETAPRPGACQRPFVKLYVLYTGDVVLCNCDWLRTTVFGNVMDTSLESLWRGQYLASIRRQHVRGGFAEGSLCSKCDYPYLV